MKTKLTKYSLWTKKIERKNAGHLLVKFVEEGGNVKKEPQAPIIFNVIMCAHIKLFF